MSIQMLIMKQAAEILMEQLAPVAQEKAQEFIFEGLRDLIKRSDTPWDDEMILPALDEMQRSGEFTLSEVLEGILDQVPDMIEDATDMMFDMIEDRVKNSATPWDDMTVLPLLATLRQGLGVPDNDS